MAKKKTAKAKPAPDLVDEIDSADEIDSIDQEAELAEALAELGGISGATITVNKLGAKGTEERVGTFMASEFNIDSLRDQYGGGVYWIYGRADGQLKSKRRVSFARSLDEQRGELGARPMPQASAGADPMRELMLENQRQQRELFQMVLTAMTANRAPAMDPMQVISAAEKLANLAGGGGKDDFLSGLKFGRELGRGAEGEPGIISVARDAIATFADVARQSQAPLPAAASAPSGDPQQMMLLIRRALAERLPILIRGAQAESDPGVYAQLVLDQLPDLYVAPLVRELQSPAWFTQLAQLDGRVVPYQSWFDAVRNEILRATSQEPPPAP